MEIAALATATSSTYAEPDGTLGAHEYATAVHAQRNGQWVNIDNTLVSDSSGVHSRMSDNGVTFSSGGSGRQ